MSDCIPCYRMPVSVRNATLNIIADTPVRAKDCKHRARCTLPAGLVVKPSGIHYAGFGVWAEKFFPKGVHFGPFEGDIYYEHSVRDKGYAWQVS